MTRRQQVSIKEYKSVIVQQLWHMYNLIQLIEISKSFTSTLDFSIFIEPLIYSCMGQRQVTVAEIFSLQQDDSSTYPLEKNSVGFDLLPNINYFFQDNRGIPPLLRQTEQPIDISELQETIADSYDLSILDSIETVLVAPLMYPKRSIGILVLEKNIFESEKKIFTREESQLIPEIATILVLSINIILLIEHSFTDMLTKLKLQCFFYTVTASKLRLVQESNIPIAIILLGIKPFKQFNDIYGHTCGDFALQRTSYLLKPHVRSDDIIARYEGKEFVQILHNVDESITRKITERIRNTVGNDDIVFSDTHLQMPLSVGYTIYNPKQIQDKKIKLEHLINLTDEAIYTFKRDGKKTRNVSSSDLLNLR